MKRAWRWILLSLLVSAPLLGCSQTPEAPSTSSEPTYTVTWIDFDESVLEIDTGVQDGTFPQYDGSTPSRDGYAFRGWNPALAPVHEDVTYQATYSESSSSIPTIYTVTFVNDDDSILYVDEVEEGQDAVYEGDTPVKEEDDDFTYEFKEWDHVLTNVTSSFVTKAVYEATAKYNWSSIHWF